RLGHEAIQFLGRARPELHVMPEGDEPTRQRLRDFASAEDAYFDRLRGGSVSRTPTVRQPQSTPCGYLSPGARVQKAVKLTTLSKTLIAAVAIAAAGMIWERTALEVFSKEAGGMRGMIGSPRSHDNGRFD